MKRIQSIKLVHKLDTDPVLDWLGTFDNEAKSDLAIEHEPNNSRTFNWFNPQPGACENQEQAQADYDRYMAYETGNWYMVGIVAVANIETGDGKVWTSQTLESGGLWGIESDSDEASMEQVEQDQLDELSDVLKEFGFTKAQIQKAAKQAERVES